MSEEKPWLWKKGQSGNPAGRTKGIDRLVREEIDAAVAEVEDPDTKQKVRLNGWQRIARKLFELALEGNVQAAKLLLERVGGYPKQDVKVESEVVTPSVDWEKLPLEKRRELLETYERLGLFGGDHEPAEPKPTEH